MEGSDKLKLIGHLLFTGIIEELGKVRSVEQRGDNAA